MPNIRLIIGGVLLLVFVSIGWYVKSLNDQVVTCKANTKIQIAQYKRHLKSYEDAIDNIAEYYDIEIKNIKDFKRKNNETACEASKRFFDNFNY